MCFLKCFISEKKTLQIMLYLFDLIWFNFPFYYFGKHCFSNISSIRFMVKFPILQLNINTKRS